jgi:predicted PurR-regulated permease PerM
MRSQWDTPIRYIVLIFALILLLAALWYVREIFQPLTTAGLIAYFLSPAVNFVVVRFGIRRRVAANLVYFLSLAVIIGLLVSAVPLLSDELQSVSNDLTRALSQLDTALQKPIMVGSLPLRFGTLIPAVRRMISGAATVPNAQDTLRILQVTSRNFLWFLVIVVTAYYLMTDWDKLRTTIINLAPRSEQADLYRLYREIRAVWLGYLRGQLRLMLVLAIIYAIAWFAIGLPGALALGVLAGILNLLPEIGPFAVAVLATIIAFVEGSTYIPVSNFWFAVITLGLYLVLNNFKTIWLQPRILGKSVFLHEGVVFVAIVAAIILQGVVGVLIIVPLLATVVVMGRYIRRKLLGLHPFEDEEPVRPWDTQPAASTTTESQPQQAPLREETQE